MRNKVDVDLDVGSATVKKAVVGIRDRNKVEVDDAPDLDRPAG